MVSIITPFYNRADILPQAIESVLSQTYSDWELLLIDDGSSDSPENVISNYSDKRIRYIKLDKNAGACHARNVGITNSTGEIIAFLDSDNVWENTYLEARVSEMTEKKCDFVFGYYCTHNVISNVSKIWPEFSAESMNDRKFVESKLFFENLIDTNTIVLTVKTVNKIGMFDESLRRFQDWDYFFRLFKTDEFRYSFQNNSLVKGYIRKDSISNSVSFWEERIRRLERDISDIKTIDMKADILYYLLKKSQTIPITDDCINIIFNKFNNLEVYQLINKLDSHIDSLNTHIENLDKLCMAKHWRFDEELMKSNSSVIVYGYGDVGKDFVTQIQNSARINLVGVVDKNISAGIIDGLKFLAIDDLSTADFDYIIIAVYNKKVCEEIEKNLISYGIEKEKIVWMDFDTNEGR